MSKVEFKCPQCQKSVLGECEDKALVCSDCRIQFETNSYEFHNPWMHRINLLSWILVWMFIILAFEGVSCGPPILFLILGPSIGYIHGNIYKWLNKNRIEVDFHSKYIWVCLAPLLTTLLITMTLVGRSNILYSNYSGLLPGGFYYGDDGMKFISIISLTSPLLIIPFIVIVAKIRFKIYKSLAWVNIVSVFILIVIGACMFMNKKPFLSRHSEAHREMAELKNISSYINSYYSDGTSTKMLSYKEILGIENISDETKKLAKFFYNEKDPYQKISMSSQPFMVIWQSYDTGVRPVLYGDGHVECFFGHFKSVEDLLRAIKDRKERGIW